VPHSSRSSLFVSRSELVGRLWPFVVINAVSLLVEPFTGGPLDSGDWSVGIALVACGLIVTAVVGHGRTLGVQTAAGVVWLAGIVILRDAAGGGSSGYGPLLMVPVLWFALYGTPRQLRLMIAGAAAALAVPLIISGVEYPPTGWRSTFVLSGLGALFGLTVQALRDRLAERTSEVAAQATELSQSLEAIPDPIGRYTAVRDASGRVIDLRCAFLNEAARRMLGSDTVGELLTVRAQCLGGNELLAEWLAAADASEPAQYEVTSRHWRPGRILILQLTRAADGVLASWRDVTLERRAEADLRTSVLRWQSFADAAADVSMVVDERLDVVHVSASIADLIGMEPADVLGQHILQVVHADDLPAVGEALRRALDADEREVVEFRLLDPRAPGRDIWLEARLSGIEGATGREITVSLRDVTFAHLERAGLAHQATHDPLTGLLNRSGLERALERTGNLELGGGFLLYIDLDRFKPINDEHGHAAGDHVLVEIGRRLLAAVRTGDGVARIGGDEFAIVGASAETPFDIDAVTTRLQLILSQPITLAGGAEVVVGASVGVAAIHSSSTVDELLTAADLDMYHTRRTARADLERPAGASFDGPRL
jgi:diguanylate cyclase (GGDEF)-like protein/PAS domain S-box-containing protein